MFIETEGTGMLEFNEEFDLFDNVIQHLEDMRNQKSRWTRAGDSILLLSLYGAIGETRSYQMLRRCGGPRDHQRELEIAHLWKVAAPHWGAVDREFAERCVLHRGCWCAANAWSDDQVRKMDGIINKVFDETRRLLVEWPIDKSESLGLFKRYVFNERNSF